MPPINIVFRTEALDSISIVYNTDGIFLIQVLQTFSRESSGVLLVDSV